MLLGKQTKQSYRFWRREAYAKMWTMGCGNTASLNNTSDSCHPTRRSLRPLIPRPYFLHPHLLPSDHIPFSLPSTKTNDFFPLNVSSSNDIESVGRDVCASQSAVSTRWNPTPEQVRTLEDLYMRGMRTPTDDQIQYITAPLRQFGKIEGKNIFYWLQNYKARERQKRRRWSEAALELVLEMDNSENKDKQYTIMADLEKNKNWGPILKTEENLWDKWVGWERELHTQQQQQQWQKERTIFTAVRSQDSALLLQRSQYAPPDGSTPAKPRRETHVLSWLRGSDCRKDEVAVCGKDTDGIETLELFPLRSHSAETALQNLRCHQHGSDDTAKTTSKKEQQACHGRQFFQFLPLEN